VSRLAIDFAKRSRWRISRIGMALLAAGLAAGSAAGWQHYRLQQEAASLSARIEQLQAPKPVATGGGASIAPTTASMLPQARQAAARAIGQLNVPWSDLFDGIEAVSTADVAWIALEPDAEQQVLHATAEAKNPAAMIALVERLKRQPPFHAVQLTRHEINERDPNRPLRFQLDARWHMPALAR
jgi:hypothetical protein